nr:cupredoxin domain-containing protein [uncultured Rhodopila sp.]
MLLAALTVALPAAAAEDVASFAIDLHDGAITPERLAVPANQPFKLEISNTGSSPAEFESLSLHKEKVLSAGVTSGMVIRRLAPGEYDFFDDFHPGSKAVLEAR